MKQLRGKTLMSLLYAVILSIPMVSILSRVIYVQSNKNAYQSYSDTTKIQTSENLQSVVGNQYIMNWVDNNTGMTNNATAIIPFQNITIDVPNGAEKFRYGNSKRLTLYDSTNTELGYVDNVITFTYIANDNQTLAQQPWFNRQLVITTFGKLDNVFDYSVSKLVDENNFGELNFFSWFEDMLLSDAQQNMLYVRFANWYMNYALLVSLMQILFLCLMWFVNFSRRLLERGMNYDW